MLPEGYVDSVEAARRLGVSVEYLRRLRRMPNQHVLHPIKVGRFYFWKEAELEEYIDTHPRLGRQAAL